jgi:hypothetical protein
MRNEPRTSLLSAALHFVNEPQPLLDPRGNLDPTTSLHSASLNVTWNLVQLVWYAQRVPLCPKPSQDQRSDYPHSAGLISDITWSLPQFVPCSQRMLIIGTLLRLKASHDR